MTSAVLLRRYMMLCERRLSEVYLARDDADERDQFLATCDFWITEVQGNDFENGYKDEAEELFLKYAHLTTPYRTVHFRSLYRGTRGMTRRQAAALVRYNRTTTFDLSESKLTSWSTNPEIAESFASKNGGVVLRYNASNLNIFLSFGELWYAMSSQERTTYDGIELGAKEAEVLVLNQPSLTVTADNIHLFTPDRRLRDQSTGW